MKDKKTYVILRLSSLSNVAMIAPVVARLSKAYPDDEFVVVALKPLADMFYGLPNVRYVEASHELENGGGLLGLYRQIMSCQPTRVFDLQNDYRTRLARWLLRWHKVPVEVVDLGRREQRALIRAGYEQSTPLKHEAERYIDTFGKCGLLPSNEPFLLPVNPKAVEKVQQVFGRKQGRWIGIAPFAKHQSNVLPYKTMKEVIAHYASEPDTRVFLFGAGHIEAEMLRQWASLWQNVESVTNHLPLDGELELMRQTDGLLCMDSANQHLAALVGCKTLSIWCGTHTSMGFAAQSMAKTQVLSLPVSCRPCTVHGTDRCRYRNFACKALTAEMIIERFDKLLNTEINETI